MINVFKTFQVLYLSINALSEFTIVQFQAHVVFGTKWGRGCGSVEEKDGYDARLHNMTLIHDQI